MFDAITQVVHLSEGTIFPALQADTQKPLYLTCLVYLLKKGGQTRQALFLGGSTRQVKCIAHLCMHANTTPVSDTGMLSLRTISICSLSSMNSKVQLSGPSDKVVDASPNTP